MSVGNAAGMVVMTDTRKIRCGIFLERSRRAECVIELVVGGTMEFRRMTMTEPLDTPDYCDPAPDSEVKRLKEDVRALKEALECSVNHLRSYYVVASPMVQVVVGRLIDRIEEEIES